ncbi:hypothetical protein [Micromonospora inaquosa]|uniref:Uncharacterized protein n=1 Tax=Micromonospora inaquosa TaxID=2203716 RepID=A0A3N9W3Q3_9ACTN|nr:hypothetical protein [Micromonospora inaquosa]RQW95463.1 hypothetical protein DLJ59_32840 [Micromonospora inaquosa]
MRRSRVVAMATGSAVVLGALWLALPLMGSDLSAQVARADFFAAHGPTPVDLRWYGGVQQFGYSLLSQPVMALLGVRVTGALALVASAAALAALLVRGRVPRPLLGSLVGVVTLAGNLASGRVTYALGVAFGLAGLLALTLSRPGAYTGQGRAGGRALLRLGLGAAGALLASATSPVAGLFVGLAGVALLLSRRYADGLAVGIAAAVPLAATALLFGDGGWMNISRTDTLRAVVTSLVVAALVSYRPVRFAALLSAAGVLAAALVHTPVGLNATRLVTMFALPVLAAAAGPPAWLTTRMAHRSAALAAPSGGTRRARLLGGVGLVALLVAVCVWQPPVVPADLRGIGDPTSASGYYTPLRAFLGERRLTGRVEVPPTRNYWEAARLGEVPLARGWLRQADIERNPLFFTTVPGASGTGVPLTPANYRAWLNENAVQYVALPDAPLSWVGRAEAALVEGGLPYLTPVWSDQHWRVWAVVDATPLVAAPAELVRVDGAAVTFRAPTAGPVAVRVRHSRWLTASGGATVIADGDWSTVVVPRPGEYTLGS